MYRLYNTTIFKLFYETNKSDLTEFEIEDDVEYELEQAIDEDGVFGENGKFKIKRTNILDSEIGMVSQTNQQLVTKKAHVGVRNENIYLPSTPVTLPDLDTNIE